MGTKSRALQLARIPGLLLLLWATGWPVQAKVEAMTRISTQDYWAPWAITVLLGFVFVVVALLGRLQPHPWPVLAIEAICACVVAVVPPLSWVLWLGIGGSWVTAMVSGFAQPLAITWLSIVGFRAFNQIRSGQTSQERHRAMVVASRRSDTT